MGRGLEQVARLLPGGRRGEGRSRRGAAVGGGCRGGDVVGGGGRQRRGVVSGASGEGGGVGETSGSGGQPWPLREGSSGRLPDDVGVGKPVKGGRKPRGGGVDGWKWEVGWPGLACAVGGVQVVEEHPEQGPNRAPHRVPAVLLPYMLPWWLDAD